VEPASARGYWPKLYEPSQWEGRHGQQHKRAFPIPRTRTVETNSQSSPFRSCRLTDIPAAPREVAGGVSLSGESVRPCGQA
jgi:hypothetical protein